MWANFPSYIVVLYMVLWKGIVFNCIREISFFIKMEINNLQLVIYNRKKNLFTIFFLLHYAWQLFVYERIKIDRGFIIIYNKTVQGNFACFFSKKKSIISRKNDAFNMCRRVIRCWKMSIWTEGLIYCVLSYVLTFALKCLISYKN